MRAAVGQRGSEGQVDRMNAYDSPETSALAHTIKRTNVNYPRTPAVDGWAPQRKPAVKSNMIRRVCLEGEKTKQQQQKTKQMLRYRLQCVTIDGFCQLTHFLGMRKTIRTAAK